MNWLLLKPWLLLVSVAVACALVQVSLFATLDFIWFNPDLILVAVLLAAMMTSVERLFGLAAIGGLMLDLYSALPFGIFCFASLAIAGVAYGLMLTVFTDRSLYTLLAMAMITTVAYHLLIILAVSLTGLVGWSEVYLGWSHLLVIAGKVWANVISVAVIFYWFNRWSRSFKPIFIRS